jgi:hypothetical protein
LVQKRRYDAGDKRSVELFELFELLLLSASG